MRDLKVTGEMVASQYNIMPLRHDIKVTKAVMIKKWMCAAIENGTMDDVYFEYIDTKICQLGKQASQSASFYLPPVLTPSFAFPFGSSRLQREQARVATPASHTVTLSTGGLTSLASACVIPPSGRGTTALLKQWRITT